MCRNHAKGAIMTNTPKPAQSVDELARQYTEHKRGHHDQYAEMIDSAFKAGYAARDGESEALKKQGDHWTDKEHFAVLDKLPRLERSNKILVEALRDMKKSCEWYSSKGTDQERHHFVAVEQIHDIDTALDQAAKELELK